MQSALAVAAWLTARGGSISDQIAPCVDDSMGVGLCATAPLPAPTRHAGFELLRIPMSLAIAADPKSDPLFLVFNEQKDQVQYSQYMKEIINI